jgi:DNA repair photolyase
LLETFVLFPVDLLVVQTRSPYVERDLDLLSQMPFAWLSMTIETNDDRTRRALTPAAPSIEGRLQAMRTARAMGIKVQAAVSPVLPHDCTVFADLLAGVCDRAVVDTFVSGDGAGGRRTARRPLPRQFGAAGLGDWRDEREARRLYEELRRRLVMGAVGWSAAGFNGLAERAQEE